MDSYDALAPIYDRLFGEDFYCAYERFIVRAVGGAGRRGLKLLDLACGTGRLGARLRRRGFHVTGVDRSRAMLALARRRGLNLVLGSLSSFRVDGAFDVAICTFDSLNHLTSLRTPFRRVAAALVPGGFFIFDLNTPFKLNAVCPAYRARRFRCAGFEVFWHHECGHDRWTSRIVLFGRGRRREAVIRERCFSREKVERWLNEAGLRRVGIFEDLRRRPVRPTSERWHFVTMKVH